jgi:hypothetical protein
VYTRASTLLSWVAIWELGFVHTSVRARTGGCGSGSSLTTLSYQSNDFLVSQQYSSEHVFDDDVDYYYYSFVDTSIETNDSFEL